MEWLKQLNLKEISYLSDKFGVQKNGRDLQVTKTFQTKDVVDAIKFLRDEIWSPENTKKAIQLIKNREGEEILNYWKSGNLEPIDNFLGRAGILDYKILAFDSLSNILYTNPANENSVSQSPNSYVQFLLENALYLVSLADWIENGHLLLIPDITVWDYQAWLALSSLNQEIHTKYDLDNTPLGKERSKYTNFEVGIGSIIEMMRLTQNNATPDFFLKDHPNITEDQASQLHKYLRSLPKSKRDEIAVQVMGEMFDIEEKFIKEKIERLERENIFRLENYVDISKLNGSLLFTQSMPLTMAMHTANELNVIPITDQQTNKWTVDLFAQVIELPEEYKTRQELTESKIELEVPFIDNLSPEFVAKQKSAGASHRFKGYLDGKWKAIRNEDKLREYEKAINDFSKSVNGDYQALREDLGRARKGLMLDLGKTTVASGALFAEEIMTNNFWIAIAKSIPVLFGGAIKDYKGYDAEKFKLKKNPLFIFLDRK